MEPSPTSNSYTTPIAIVFGFALIAIAIYFSGIGGGGGTPKNSGPTATAPTAQGGTLRPVDDTDFIRGNPNAPIMIVEYSDYDCTFCQVFHETMNQIMNEYGAGGKVAWVYRQMPVKDLHPNAPRISEAALCVGDIAGNDAFWKFSDAVFKGREVNQLTNISRLPTYATEAGADLASFTSCLESGRMKERVEASVQEGIALGIEGTPHSILLVGDQQAVIEGAQPYAAVRGIVDNLIKQLEGTAPTAPETPAEGAPATN